MNGSTPPCNSSNEQVLKLVGNPTVLVADDEELMREVISIMIEDNGGTVLTASDGAEAIEVFKKNSAAISLLVLDFSMPSKNGYEVYKEIQSIKPQVKTLICSGLRISSEVEAALRAGEIAFLSKPFGEAELICCLKKLQD